jgi:hypothetical protein
MGAGAGRAMGAGAARGAAAGAARGAAAGPPFFGGSAAAPPMDAVSMAKATAVVARPVKRNIVF